MLNIDAAKISKAPKVEVAQDNIAVSFTTEEWSHFKDEIYKQFTEGDIADLDKAINNAKYLVMLDRGFNDMETGKGTAMTFEELKILINGQSNF